MAPASHAKTEWVSLAAFLPWPLTVKSPKPSASGVGFDGVVTSSMLIPPKPAGSLHFSLFVTRIWPLKAGVVMSTACTPSPGALPSLETMNPVSRGAAGFVMSTTWTPLYLHVSPPQAAR